MIFWSPNHCCLRYISIPQITQQFQRRKKAWWISWHGGSSNLHNDGGPSRLSCKWNKFIVLWFLILNFCRLYCQRYLFWLRYYHGWISCRLPLHGRAWSCFEHKNWLSVLGAWNLRGDFVEDRILEGEKWKLILHSIMWFGICWKWQEKSDKIL